ncbi:MAG: hypothetical protein ACPGJE_04095, partial [Wenzhouxiangellaceae bacterium]
MFALLFGIAPPFVDDAQLGTHARQFLIGLINLTVNITLLPLQRGEDVGLFFQRLECSLRFSDRGGRRAPVQVVELLEHVQPGQVIQPGRDGLQFAPESGDGVGYNLCFSALQRLDDGRWLDVDRSETGDPAFCPTVLYGLEPGESAESE